MPSKNQALRLQDIIEAAADIASWIGDMDEAAFCKDRKTIRSVERSIEIVSEATVKLNDGVKSRIGDYPWRDMYNMANRLRHGYDKVALHEVWRTAAVDIPSLAADCRRVLEGMRQP